MNIYDIWITGKGECHLIRKMTTDYIYHCINQINKAADGWRMLTFPDLSDEDKKEIHEPLHKAWFVFNALDYLYSFKRELEVRCEDTDNVDAVVDRIAKARQDY